MKKLAQGLKILAPDLFYRESAGFSCLRFSMTYFPTIYAQSINGMTVGQGIGACFTPAEMRLNVDILKSLLVAVNCLFMQLQTTCRLRLSFNYIIQRTSGSCPYFCCKGNSFLRNQQNSHSK